MQADLGEPENLLGVLADGVKNMKKQGEVGVYSFCFVM